MIFLLIFVAICDLVHGVETNSHVRQQLKHLDLFFLHIADSRISLVFQNDFQMMLAVLIGHL